MKRTIVGGRPPAEGGGIPFPPGIDVLLRKASVDPRFRDLLLADADGAAASIGLQLTPTERRVLSSISPVELDRAVDGVHVPDLERPVFRGAAAAAMVAAVLGTVVACGIAAPTGARIDEPPPPPTGEEEPAQPQGSSVPPCVEVLLRKASVDPVFQDLLLRDAEAAAVSIGLGLTDAERVLLLSLAPEEMERWIATAHVPAEHQAVFAGTSGQAMLALVAGGMSAGAE